MNSQPPEKTLTELQIEQRQIASNLVSRMIELAQSLESSENVTSFVDTLVEIGKKVATSQVDDNSLDLRTKLIIVLGALVREVTAVSTTSFATPVIVEEYKRAALMELRTLDRELSGKLAWLNHFDHNVPIHNGERAPAANLLAGKSSENPSVAR